MTRHRDLFSKRQLNALTTFSTLVPEVRDRVAADGAPDEYAIAVSTYLALAVGRAADYWSSFAIWASDFIAHTFGRNALSMVWDYAEANPFSDATGNWSGGVDWIARVITNLPASGFASVEQKPAQSISSKVPLLFSTDPPYYDNVPYADLSDFFYVWLRRSLIGVTPELFTTVLVPKAEELVAEPFRHGSADNARKFFEDGMGVVFGKLRDACSADYPATVYYGFKQSEDDSDDVNGTAQASTGWETILEGLRGAGWAITSTWPVRTERPGRLRETGSNALASSIVLACRPRQIDAALATRREFINALKRELPDSLRHLQRSSIAPVDVAQAAIGPGMSVFTRYAKVMEADGSPMSVRQALTLINQTLDEVLAEQEGEFDGDTRWAGDLTVAIIISKDGKGARKVEQSGVKDEAYLQRYVSDNPDSLPLDEVKDDARLLVVGREYPTRSGPIDVLAVDRDGDLYVIETKLFKNPDKRLVVAQMLDYGASLWKGYAEPADFIAEIERQFARSGGDSLAHRLTTMYGLAAEESAGVIEQLKRNLLDGKIRFVVLMDRLHEALRDMILFINEKSRFDIYAVEMEFYRHGDLEIVIPKLYGAEVRKEVPSTAGSAGGRRKWDETAFFAAAETQLKPDDLRAVRRLYEFAMTGADEISWGTGVARGSFNPKYLKASPRSLFSVYTDGTLQLNFGWLGRDNAGAHHRDRFKAELDTAKLFTLPAGYADEYIGIEASKWVPSVEAFIRAVEQTLGNA